MKNKVGTKYLLFVLTLMLIFNSAFAHSGRTDSNGGHNKTADGTYHYHSGEDRMIEYATRDEADRGVSDILEISVLLNGEPIIFDQPPIIIDERTLVPIRAIFETLGETVEWDENTRTVTSNRGDVIVTMQIGNRIMTKNGTEIELDVPAQLVNDRTLVPVRAVAESFGTVVGWDAGSKVVSLMI